MSSKKKQWTAEEEKHLFQLHAQFGNKWAYIASQIDSKDDNSIKNKFYSTLRKGLRKINKYITSIKKKSDPQRFKAYKILQQLFIVKLIAVADRKYEEKYEVKEKAIQLSSSIQQRMIKIACSDEQYLKLNSSQYQIEENLLTDIQEFTKNCKRRKGKKKNDGQKGHFEDNEDSEELHNELANIENVIENHQQVENQNQQIVKNEFNNQSDQPRVITTQNTIESAPQTETKQQYSIFLNTCDKTDKKIDNQIGAFAMMAEGFLKYHENMVAEDNGMLQSQGNLSQSNSWLYESTNTTRQLSKKMSNYLTQPSPHPTDPYSPFTFQNLMKTKNITGSNMFDDKSSCLDLLDGQKNGGGNSSDNIISFVEQIPRFQVSNASYLIRSADLKRDSQPLKGQFDQNQLLAMSLNMSKDSQLNFHQMIPIIQEKHFFRSGNDNFVNEYAFTDQNCKLVESQLFQTPKQI